MEEPDQDLEFKFDDRDLVLSKLSEAIDHLHKKAISGRIYDTKNEKVRIDWFRAFAYTCSIYNQIKKDIELDELKDEIKTIKESINQNK